MTLVIHWIFLLHTFTLVRYHQPLHWLSDLKTLSASSQSQRFVFPYTVRSRSKVVWVIVSFSWPEGTMTCAYGRQRNVKTRNSLCCRIQGTGERLSFWTFPLILSLSGKRLHHKKHLHYQAEENSNITLEWQFSSHVDISVPSLKIHCVLTTDLRVFFHLDNTSEEPPHEQFAGRVQCDTDALAAGLVRLHVLRVRTNDSGLYLCRMATAFGRRVKAFSLNITGEMSHMCASFHSCVF